MGTDYTPGPWHASKDRDSHGAYGWRIDSASRALMAWLAWPDEQERDSAEATITAYLMAAAPELLEALEEMVRIFNPDKQGIYEFARPATERGRQVIKKARWGAELRNAEPNSVPREMLDDPLTGQALSNDITEQYKACKPSERDERGWPDPGKLEKHQLVSLVQRMQGILWGQYRNPDTPEPDKEWDSDTIDNLASELIREGLKP